VSGPESVVDAFLEALVELEPSPEQLRRDPEGRGWLPAKLRAEAEADPDCAAELAEFVAMELALFDVHEPCDAFFTRRVLDRLPEIEAVDQRRRTWILASAYALAIGVAYLILGPLLSAGTLSSWIAPVVDWAGGQALAESGGVWMALALLTVAGALVFIPVGERRIRA